MSALLTDPVTVALALSFYHDKLSPFERANNVIEHFEVNQIERTIGSGSLAAIIANRGVQAFRLMPRDMLVVYINHALEFYGKYNESQI